MAATCPECDSDIDIDEADVDIGDELSCSECGALLRVASRFAGRARTRRRDDEDEDEDVDEEDEDEEDGEEEEDEDWDDRDDENSVPDDAAGQGAHAPRHPLRAGIGRRRLQRRRRQRVPRAHGAPGTRAAGRLRSPPTAPAIPMRIASWRCAWPPSSRFRTRSSGPTSSNARSTAPTRPIAATTAKTSCTRISSRLARARGFAAVADGANRDDRGDYRPGRQAAREHGVRSPLDEAELSKDEIRLLSRAAGLPTWDVPASACLSSRIPYGSEVTEEKLRLIERAEDVLRDARFPGVPRAAPRHAGAARDRQGRNGARARARRRRATDARAARARLSARHDRPSGLPARQPQRSAAAATGLEYVESRLQHL